jgi:DNA-directed RNA polymerase specialized sigma24 family protein
MLAGARKYDLDLSRMGDEALVILAQECAFRPAIDEVLRRYYEPMSHLIALKARCLWLAADLPDAQQNAVFAILEAITDYDTREVAKPRGCRFRTYLCMVVTARFGDFVRQVRRVRRHYCRLEEAGEKRASGQGRCPGSRTSDPVEALARREARARLHHALEGLDEALRRLWRELADGKKKLPQITGKSSMRVLKSGVCQVFRLLGAPYSVRHLPQSQPGDRPKSTIVRQPCRLARGRPRGGCERTRLGDYLLSVAEGGLPGVAGTDDAVLVDQKQAVQGSTAVAAERPKGVMIHIDQQAESVRG